MIQLQNFKKNGISPIVIDVRDKSNSSGAKEAKSLNIDIRFSHAIANAKGYRRVKSATVGKLNEKKSNYEKLEEISCDCICFSGNWTPTVHLSSQSGNKLKFNEKINAFVPNQPRQNESTVGSANGSFTLKNLQKKGLIKVLKYQTK